MLLSGYIFTLRGGCLFRTDVMLCRLRSALASSEIKPTKKQDSFEKNTHKQQMSMAMKFYMEKKRNHDAFIAKERSEFELGKAHLASMMGLQADTMNQEDIDKSIQYLFPSGLHPSARPVMKPPEEIFPKQKNAEFDISGRPFHPFFYCIRPNFYRLMYDIVENIEDVTFFADRQQAHRKQISVSTTALESDSENVTLNMLSGSRWVSKSEIEAILLEDLKEKEYDSFIEAIERLTQMPYVWDDKKYRDFIFTYRINTGELSSIDDVLQPTEDENGRLSVEFIGQRRSSCCQVRVIKPGVGLFSIQHADYMDHPTDIQYFYSIKERQQLLYPLQFTKQLGKVDVECIVDSGGPSSQAGAIRYAISMCLRSFVDRKTVDDMRICGLLTQDVRVPERKKPGQPKARRKFTWKKR